MFKPSVSLRICVVLLFVNVLLAATMPEPVMFIASAVLFASLSLFWYVQEDPK